MKNTIRNTQYAILITLILAWLILPQIAQAATYYVDIDGVGEDGILGTADDVISSDANPGTSEQPWKTIARAYDSSALTPNVGPGDTVYLRNGNYGIFNERNVTRTNWITYKNATGHTPVFAGIAINNSTRINTYLKFDGIKVQQPLPDPMPPDDGYNHLVGYIVHFKRTNYMDIRNCTLVGCNKYLTTSLFMVDNSSHVTVHHNDMSVARGGFQINLTSDSELTYNYLHNISEGTGIRILPGNSNILVEGNHLTDGNNDKNDPYYPHLAGTGWHQGTGIGIRSSNLTIRNNIVHDIRWPQGMMFYGIGQAFHDITIENNLFYDCQEFKFYDCGTNILIRNNTFVGEVVRYTTRYDEMHNVNVTNRYWMPVPTLSMYSGYDGNSVELYNNIGIGYWSMPDPTDPTNLYQENYNIIWSKLDATNNTKGAHTKIVVWSSGGLRGCPNYFEDIGYRSSTPEYNYTADGTRPFFVNPGFYTGTAQGGKDKGKFWDYHLAPGSPGINFGAPEVATWQEVLSGRVTGPSQPPDSLGSVGPDGFIRNDGPARDADHHSAGCYEYGASTFLYGDVNSDGEVTAFDAALTAHIAVDLEHPDIKNRAAAEVSGDAEVSAYDAALIARRAVGLIDKFPVE